MRFDSIAGPGPSAAGRVRVPCGSGLDPNPRADGRRTVKASVRPPRRKPDETAGFVRGVYDQSDSSQEAIARIIATDTARWLSTESRRRGERRREAKGWDEVGGRRAAAGQRTPRLSTSPPERSGRALVVVAELQREKRRTSATSRNRFSGINQTVRDRRPSTTGIGRSRGPSGAARFGALSLPRTRTREPTGPHGSRS